MNPVNPGKKGYKNFEDRKLSDISVVVCEPYRGLTRHRWTDYQRALQAYISTEHSDSMAAVAL